MHLAAPGGRRRQEARGKNLKGVQRSVVKPIKKNGACYGPIESAQVNGKWNHVKSMIMIFLGEP